MNEKKNIEKKKHASWSDGVVVSYNCKEMKICFLDWSDTIEIILNTLRKNIIKNTDHQTNSLDVAQLEKWNKFNYILETPPFSLTYI